MAPLFSPAVIRMNWSGRLRLLFLALAATWFACASSAHELKPHTSKAFQRYQELTEARILHELADPASFLYLDSLPPDQRELESLRVKNGMVFIRPLSTKDGGKKIEIPEGLVHHWIAVAFIANARMEQVIRVVEDYSHYGQVFKPDVQRCEVLSQDSERFRVYYRFYKHTLVTVTYNAEFEIEFHKETPGQQYSMAHATRIAEVRSAGEKDEREYPVGNDHGFLWRLNFYTRYIEADGGVYVQVEMVSLSRTVPAILAWIVNPYLKSIPRDYLTDYMRRLNKAVTRIPNPALDAETEAH